MKLPTSPYSKQKGFTLIESLIALVIFSIIVMGSGAAISKMLTVQKNMNVDFLIINNMQEKLQSALNNDVGNSTCSAVEFDKNIEIAGQTYYVACAVETIPAGTTNIEWPVLAVSTNLATAQSCATGQLDSSCYVVGR